MEKILKTDSAYSAIEKINANFDSVSTVGNKRIEGSISGSGDDTVFYQYEAAPGDYIHIYFPDGTWQTKSTRTNYNRFYIGYVNENGDRVGICNMCHEGWSVPSYGFDFYIPDDITDMDTAFLAFRAKSGVELKFILTWLDKEEMKPYFSDEMVDTVAKVRARQIGPCATFALCTDLHYRDIVEQYRPFAPYAPLAMTLTMKELGKRVRLDNVICMGDIIDGRQSVAQAKKDVNDIMRFFARTEVPLLYSMGNHDDNRYYHKDGGDRLFTKPEIHAYYVEHADERTSVGGAEYGCNYYRDLERNKIRLIILCSTNIAGSYNFTSDTRTWLTNTFASMPLGYKAIIFSHTPLQGDHAYGESFTSGSAVKDIINSNLDKFIIFFDGHTHADAQWASPILEVTLGASKCYNTQDGTPGADGPAEAYFCERAAGNEKEVLWDVVVVDADNELVSCIRFGAGVDRYVHYMPVEVAAGGTTTLIPTVIVADNWNTREDESSLISVADGAVSVDSSAEAGSRLMIRAYDEDGNIEIWCIKVTS